MQDTVMITAAAAVAALSSLPIITRQFQMLQQNSYFAVRYLRWYKGAFGVKTAARLIIALLSAASVLLCTGKAATAALSAVMLLLCFFAVYSLRLDRRSVKPLVVTARVKRMYATAGVLFAALFAVSVLTGGSCKKIFAAAAVFLALCPGLTTLFVLFIMKPVEKAISNHYIRDAKRILASQKGLRIIGVTGSYGKTSTKFILGRILSEKYNTLITPENYNTPMGIVITVRKFLRPQTEVFVCEMGAKRKGDIAADCDIAEPSMGIITSVGPQHLDTFGSIETVADTKFELADRVEKNGGVTVLYGDNDIIAKRKDKYNSFTYGAGDCDCKATNISYSPEGLSLTVTCGDTKINLRSRLLGYNNAMNITGAVAVALKMGVPPEQIAYAVSTLKPVEHRLEMKPYIGGSTLIDDAYNSNPEGCLSALEVLAGFEDFKKILVTPGLVELGEKEYECNRKLGEAATASADIIILVGEKRSLPIAEGVLSSGFPEDALHTVPSFAAARELFSPLCDKNTVIMFENDLPDNYLY